ncbi:2673_t:CDS:10 [Paraglomus brasilianum]|uniref:2673_t:CDS:1 n=1 Tax=Paraglomus brasilianum TaxID=144538 RepID=A0A9N8VYE7_9GLOM|nr:2673_t:CDS:10 [Paraglomus brasilianum]
MSKDTRIPPTPSNNPGLLRQGHGAKAALREKFVEIYESFFKGIDPAAGNPYFWNELFLLKVNAPYLSQTLAGMSEEKLLKIKHNINLILVKSMEVMSQDNNSLRIMNAIETLCVFLQGIFSKRFNNFSFEVINLLTGLDKANDVFPRLIETIERLIRGGETVQIRHLALQLAVVIICGNSNINQNSINEYFIQRDMFDALIEFIVHPETIHLAYDAITLLGILANFKKHESTNPYLVKLSTLKDNNVLQKIMEVLGSTCVRCRSQYTDIMADDDASKVSVSNMLSYVGGLLYWNGPKPGDVQSDIEGLFAKLPSPNAAILLTFYDLINTNKQFISIIAQSITPRDSPSTEISDNKDLQCMRDFLSFTSYMLQHNRSPRTAIYTKLCLFTILILIENSIVCSYFCDESRNVEIKLCRQRPPQLPYVNGPRPVASAIIDIMVSFVTHNMRRKLQFDLYSYALSIIHRIIAFLNKYQIRLAYHWVELWRALISLTKFIVTNINQMENRDDIEDVLHSIIRILNMGITYGDTFLPDPPSYDNLFYEIVRSAEVFEQVTLKVNLQSSERSTMDSKPQRSALDAKSIGISNIKSICAHFSSKIDEWKESRRAQSISPSQVLVIIKANYETLTLPTPGKLGYYTPYTEIPHQVAFLRQALRTVVDDFKGGEIIT